jgi:hypothetical protein
MQSISQCRECGELFGTNAARVLHRHNDKCRTSRSMRQHGAWRGLAGIWWTPDLAWNDATETFANGPSETRAVAGVQVGKNGGSVGRGQPPTFSDLCSGVSA